MDIAKTNSYHVPVMLEEVIDGLAIAPTGCYADLTFGGGGHANRILNMLSTGRLFAFDKDMAAARMAALCLNPALTFIRAPFRFLKEFLNFYGIEKIDGILADLGISSHQIDQPERGFSTRFDAVLDMRMNQQMPHTAQDVVNSYSLQEIVRLLRSYGELAEAVAVAKAIVKSRMHTPILTTQQLKAIAEPFAPSIKRDQFFSKIFQAFRIEVNDELSELAWMLKRSVDILKPNGRIVVISYHSLEDRLVKNFLKTGNVDGNVVQDPYGQLIRPFKPLYTKPLTPSLDEIACNKRARSARLRIGVRI